MQSALDRQSLNAQGQYWTCAERAGCESSGRGGGCGSTRAPSSAGGSVRRPAGAATSSTGQDQGGPWILM